MDCLVNLRHSEPFAFCHSEGALRRCHSERSEESYTAQGELRDRRISLRVTIKHSQ